MFQAKGGSVILRGQKKKDSGEAYNYQSGSLNRVEAETKFMNSTVDCYLLVRRLWVRYFISLLFNLFMRSRGMFQKSQSV